MSQPCSVLPTPSSIQPNGWCLTVQLPAQLFLMLTVSHHPLSFLLIHMISSPCPAHLVVSHFLFLKAELEEEGNKPKHTRMLPVSLCATTGMLYNPNFSSPTGKCQHKEAVRFPRKMRTGTRFVLCKNPTNPMEKLLVLRTWRTVSLLVAKPLLPHLCHCNLPSPGWMQKL